MRMLLTKIFVAAIATVLLISPGTALAGGTPTPSSAAPSVTSQRNPAPYQGNPAPLSQMAYQYFSRPTLSLGSGTGLAQLSMPTSSASQSSSSHDPIFNLEVGNLPQDEESLVAYNTTSGVVVVQGANDYRGLFQALCNGQGISGYYVSTNGGASVNNEGCLPILQGVRSDGLPYAANSYGDPTLARSAATGSIFYTSLYEAFGPGLKATALGLAKATPTSITTASPWTVAQIVADPPFPAFPYVFHDKPWMTVDNFPATANYGTIYVSWTKFSAFGSVIMLAKCVETPYLFCSAPITVSGPYTSTQGSFVSVDSSGNIIVTFTNYYFYPYSPPYFYVALFYTVLSPTFAVVKAPTFITATLTAGFALSGSDFRVPVLPQSAPAVTTTGVPRLFVVWHACGSFDVNVPTFAYGDKCAFSYVWLANIDNYATASPTFGFNFIYLFGWQTFFPSLSVNQAANRIDIAYYTQHAVVGSIYASYQRRGLDAPGTVYTTLYNYASAESGDNFFYTFFFGGSGIFIGDYIQIVEISAGGGIAGSASVYIGFTGNAFRDSSSALGTWYQAGPNWGGLAGLNFQLGGAQDDNLLWSFTYYPP